MANNSPIRPLVLLTGPAGSGKTTYVKRRIKEDHKWAILAATTGIAAVNLGDSTGEPVRTINSLLGYYNLEELEEKYQEGEIERRFVALAKQSRRIVVDECSMLSAEQFEYIFRALLMANDRTEVVQRGGFGIVLVGDFCQLPPVKGSYVFRSHWWQEYMEGKGEKNVVRLSKIWRQTSQDFLDALNYARTGDGEKCAHIMQNLEGVQWRMRVDTHFEGTSIFPTNKQVDRENTIRLNELLEQGRELEKIPSYRWGVRDREGYYIPNELELCRGAYVMNYVNVNSDNGIVCANGDCGYVVDVIKDAPTKDKPEQTKPEQTKSGQTKPEQTNSIWRYMVEIELVRNGNTVKIKPDIRQTTQRAKPDGAADVPPAMSAKDFYICVKGIRKTIRDDGIKQEDIEAMLNPEQELAWISVRDVIFDSETTDKGLYKSYLANMTAKFCPKSDKPLPYYSYEKRRWIVGETVYMPLRLAYATTVHKSQGLTLDRVQIDLKHRFIGEPCMMYVALSRWKGPNPEDIKPGMVIVGTSDMLAKRTNTYADLKIWF